MEAFIGTILPWPMDWAPRGWALCNGQALPISQYTAVFSLLGTTYGGDGRTNFKLPDLRSRVPLGMGQGPGLSNRTLGQIGGTESATATGTGAAQVTLTVDNLPAHSHAVSGEVKVGVADENGVVSGAPNNVLGKKAFDINGASSSPIEIYVAGADAHFTQGNKLGAVSHNLTAANTGGGKPVTAPVNVSTNGPIMEPYLVMNYIICLEGIFPSRP